MVAAAAAVAAAATESVAAAAAVAGNCGSVAFDVADVVRSS